MFYIIQHVGLGDHFRGCKRQMWSSCAPAPSYSCASALELSVLDHKSSVGNIGMLQGKFGPIYRRVVSWNSSMFMVSLTWYKCWTLHNWWWQKCIVTHLCTPTTSWFQGLQRHLSDPQCFGGALSFASWSLSKGAMWMFGKRAPWETGEDETINKSTNLSRISSTETVLRSVFVPVSDFRSLLLLGLHGMKHHQRRSYPWI